MDDPPAAHALAVEREVGGQAIEAAAEAPDGVWIAGELGPAIAEKRGGVERTLADERLWVDREPGLALGAQDVSAVQVLVEDDRFLARSRRGEESDRLVEQRSLERPAEARPARRKLASPASRLVLQSAERRPGRGRPRETAEDRRGDGQCLVFVRLGERRPRLAPLEEERAPTRVVCEEANGAQALPVRERMRLVFALAMRDVQLEHGGTAVREPNRSDVRDVCRLHGLPEAKRPRLRDLADEARERCQPLLAARLLSELVEPSREVDGRPHVSTLYDPGCVRLSPVLTAQATYPFVRLDEAKRRVAARGVELLDFGMGDPRERIDPRIERALAEALPATEGYPRAQGLPELRSAIARWCERRFRVAVDPDREVIPTLGSKEAIFSFAQVLVDPGSGRDVVVTTDPGYPVPERGAAFAHAEVVRLPLREEDGFLPDLDSLDEDTWRRAAIVWVNYPNNPTGATAPLSFYEALAALAAAHDVVLASDEAYSELWFDEPPPSALQVRDSGARVAVFNSLSKRSSMTGYRSGFVAGDGEMVAALRAFRPNAGTAPQEFVQRASVTAWEDEEHVERNRALYARKRALLLDLFARKHIRVAGSRATIYLWVEVPDGESSERFAERLLEAGIVVTPGSYLGDAGEGYVRFALVPTEDECARAVDRLDSLL